MSFGIYHQLSIFDQQQYQAEVTRNISTAESPGRCTKPLGMNQQDLVNTYSKFTVEQLLEAYHNPNDYTDEAKEALAIVIKIVVG